MVWFPIRHHSPACARHVEQLIHRRRPWAVLVEGPPSFDDVIGHLIDPGAAMPLAIHAHVVNTLGDGGDGDRGGDGGEAARRRGVYFPLCDYSPELVALRAGAAVGARLGFADLDYADPAWLDGTDGAHALVDEHRYAASTALTALADRMGCRDHNELWDHLVESAELDTEALVAAVSTYGLLTRWGSTGAVDPGAAAAGDLDTVREGAMVARVRAWAAERAETGATGPIVVVTGAYHTAVLPERYAADPPAAARPAPGGRRPVAGHGLVRYSFDRLDALSGYAAGMPSPAWYQELWDLGDHPRPAAEAAHCILRDVAADLRAGGGDGQPSTPGLVDAHAQAELLRRLRQRSAVARTDVADAALSCFARGEDGHDVRSALAARMTGDRVGRLPPGAPRSPLAADFDRRAASLRLRIDRASPLRVELAIHRSERDRLVSRFLHGLGSVGVAYGQLIQSPRWTSALGRDLTREIWTCQLSAETDITLAEASMWGSTVAEAVGVKLGHRLGELLAHQPTAVSLLSLVQDAARCGVHDAIDPILASLRRRIADVPDLTDVAAALVEADLLWTARRPLDGPALAGLPAVGEQLHLRACALIPASAGTAPVGASAGPGSGAPDEQLVENLRRVHHVAGTATWLSLDDSLLWDATDRLAAATASPRVHGAVDGLRWHNGRVDAAQLLTRASGHLAAADGAVGSGYLAGLLAVAREALWEVDGLLGAVSDVLGSIDDGEFVRRLPGLRSVFALLTPSETDRVAEHLGPLTGGGAAPIVRDLGEQALLANVEASAAVARRLVDDGLGAWLAAAPDGGGRG